MPLINITIDDRQIKTESNQTIYSVAAQNNIYIPTLCNDERVAMYGSCGICVVEAEKAPRLLRACSTFVSDGMIIQTNSERVKNTRKAALELILSDHKGDCRPPCILACPGQTDCQGYIGFIANRQYREAVELMKEQLPLPSSIGRVCPHPCETACRRELVEEPISIAYLKYFAADRFIGENEFIPEVLPDTGKSVAIIGGGPGGLTAAYFLRQGGHSVSIYDAMPKMGGMLRYGIPEYRLPKKILDAEIAIISKMGVTFINDAKVGTPELSLSDLQKKFDAVLVAIGAWSSVALRCPGENLNGVFGGIDFLQDVALGKAPSIGEKVAIVGGGNTAMDACRTAVRLGAKEVYNIYRRTRDEMPAEEIEIDEAEEEGVVFKYLTNPIEIIEENGRVSKIRLQKMKLGEPDASGRRSPVPIEGEEETLAMDTVIVAIGQTAKTGGFEELTHTKRNTIAADESTFRTNLDGVFAVGDATNKGADIAIAAIGEAKKAVSIIEGYLKGQSVTYSEPYLVKTEPTAEDFTDREKDSRAKMRHLSPVERKSNFQEVNFGFSEDEAVKEATRCLECGCIDYFECKLINTAGDYNVNPLKYEGEIVPNEANDEHPFIYRNPGKCILCGLCMRICEDVMGVTALGLVNRGFDAVVKPAFDTALQKSGCISCGQCVTVCPTGALTEKIAGFKQVPVEENLSFTICSFCSVGCPTMLKTKGDMLLRNLPDNTRNKQQILCAKGRFGFTELAKVKRLTTPFIANTETDLGKASAHINQKIKEIISRHGVESAAITVSDRFTNEEIALAKQYADALGIGAYSLNRKRSGLASVNGKDASTCNFDELMNADLVLLVASDIMNTNPVAGIYVRKAVQNGAKLIIVNDGTAGLADEWCDVKLVADNNLDMLKAFANDPGPNAPENVKNAVTMYKAAKKAVVIFEQNFLSEAAGALLAKIAASQAGIIQLKLNANSQGLADLDLGYADELIEKINNKTVKALIVFAEDAGEVVDVSALEFLCVGDVYLTETAKKAGVVLPCASFAESEGTYTNTVGQRQTLNRALPPVGGYTNTEIIQSLINKAGTSGAAKAKPAVAPAGKIPDDAKLFAESRNTNALFNRIDKVLKQLQ